MMIVGAMIRQNNKGFDMRCSCIIDSDYDHDHGSRPVSIKTPFARKPHKCTECGCTVKIGEKYEYASIITDGRFQVFKTCLDCVSFRDALFCGWTYTELWEEFAEGLDGMQDLPSAECMVSMTKVARDKVCDLYEAEWEVWDVFDSNNIINGFPLAHLRR